MKTRIYQTENNPIFINYDSWATKQLQYNYDDRRAILLWKAERLARLVPAHIHFSTALEVGCAEGIVINRLRELLQIKECFGIDICQPFLSFGKENYPNIKFIQYSGSSLPFSDKSIDLIILSDIIEHISDLCSFFGEVKRVGRYALLKVPLDKYLWRKVISEPLGRSYSVGSEHPDGHLHEFSKNSCEKMLKNMGFKILTSKVAYSYMGKDAYNKKNSILKVRWFLDTKVKQLFPRVAHVVFGGNLIVLFDTGE